MVANPLRNFNPVPSPTSRSLSPPPPEDEERKACIGVAPPGLHLRPPPPAHLLTDFITPDAALFQTIHMGPAVVDLAKWRLVITGMVQRPFSLTLEQLKQFEVSSITSFHECYGSPIKPPVENVWRIGNVTWSGVRLSTLLALAQPLVGARYVWSEGLDYGSFGGVQGIDRYQKDLPVEKAVGSEVLAAWMMNGELLGKERGGPVRLVVPGWFGTNSTKWLCKLSLRSERAGSLFTTKWYNEVDPTKEDGSTRPVWGVEPNSLIVKPEPGAVVGEDVVVRGWAWSCDGIERVEVDIDGSSCMCWEAAILETRKEFEWQAWSVRLKLSGGDHTIRARATSKEGAQQPISGRRNHMHSITICVQPGMIEDMGN